MDKRANHKVSHFAPMFDNDLSNSSPRHPLVSLCLVLITVGLGFIIVGPMIGFLVALPFYPGSMLQLADDLQNPTAHPEVKIPLYIIQGFATFVGLIVGPAWFLTTERKSVLSFFRNKHVELLPLLVTVLLVVVFMGVNSIFIEWNSNINLPDWGGFESWAKEKEQIATELTKFMTEFDSTNQLLIAFFVIAILPAVGEEIVFRGVIQNQLFQSTKNIHASIWIAAAVFSAIHFQFFGFVPRMLLGALFGYLYYWSGNLWLPIVAHFVNNGFSVIAMYFYQKGDVQFDVEDIDAVPANFVIFSAFATIGLLYYLHKYFETRKIHTDTL